VTHSSGITGENWFERCRSWGAERRNDQCTRGKPRIRHICSSRSPELQQAIPRILPGIIVNGGSALLAIVVCKSVQMVDRRTSIRSFWLCTAQERGCQWYDREMPRGWTTAHATRTGLASEPPKPDPCSHRLDVKVRNGAAVMGQEQAQNACLLLDWKCAIAGKSRRLLQVLDGRVVREGRVSILLAAMALHRSDLTYIVRK
jgi:hypothetical protein